MNIFKLRNKCKDNKHQPYHRLSKIISKYFTSLEFIPVVWSISILIAFIGVVISRIDFLIVLFVPYIISIFCLYSDFKKFKKESQD